MSSTNAPFRVVCSTTRHELWSTNRPKPPVVPTHSGFLSGFQSLGNTVVPGRKEPPSRPNSPPTSPPKPPRWIIDFDPDDNEWEDEDVLLEVIPVRKHRCIVHDANSHATVEARHEKTGGLDLAADLTTWEVEHKERMQDLAEKHCMKVKEVRRQMLLSSAFKPKHKVSVYNAKIACIMAGLNEGQELGARYTLAEVKCMVVANPTMLDGFTREEEAEMVEEVEVKRKTKFHGTRANNLAAGADAKRTVEHMMTEIISLAEHTGIIGFAIFTRSHIHDKTIAVTIQLWGALDFFCEILKKDPVDVAALFKLWAVVISVLNKVGIQKTADRKRPDSILSDEDKGATAVVISYNVATTSTVYGLPP
ncbi:hypothetical protein DFH09DRAFT_1337849 [Mycena vulgaris]|nr:hypothetical protein DFH09DRAFT_1337849 [Mycena vulgaris]